MGAATHQTSDRPLSIVRYCVVDFIAGAPTLRSCLEGRRTIFIVVLDEKFRWTAAVMIASFRPGGGDFKFIVAIEASVIVIGSFYWGINISLRRQ